MPSCCACGTMQPTPVELGGDRAEVVPLLLEARADDRLRRGLAPGVAAVPEEAVRDHDQLPARDEHVDEQAKVQDHAVLGSEVDVGDDVAPPAEAGEVGPVPRHQGDERVLAGKGGGAAGWGRRYLLTRSTRGSTALARVVDDLDTGAHDRCARVLRECALYGGDVPGFQQVVAAHEHDMLGSRQRECPAEVAVDPESLLVADVDHVGALERGQPVARHLVGIAVIHDHEPPARRVLVEDAAHGEPHQLGVAVEGQQHVDHVTPPRRSVPERECVGVPGERLPPRQQEREHAAGQGQGRDQHHCGRAAVREAGRQALVPHRPRDRRRRRSSAPAHTAPPRVRSGSLGGRAPALLRASPASAGKPTARARA